VLQAYVRALDALDLDIDLHGLDVGMEDEMVERVQQALDRYAETLAADLREQAATG
jgi:hypothetical protein